MKGGLFWCVSVILAGCARQQGSDLRTGTLDVLATESHLPLVQRQAEEYHRIFSEAEVHVRGTTTREAIVEMLNEKVECIVVDRALNAEEQQVAQQAKLRVVETEIARDALAILVHSSNKLDAVSLDVLASILEGKATDWKQLRGSNLAGPIKLCLTGRNSGLYELLTRYFFKQEKEILPHFVAPSEARIVKYVSEHPDAIGIVSYASWRDTTRTADQRLKSPVKLLDVLARDRDGAVAAVKLHQKNIYDQVYPLTYSLYIYTAQKKAGVGLGFSTFIAGQTGQKIFLDAGLVPKTMPYRVIQLTQE